MRKAGARVPWVGIVALLAGACSGQRASSTDVLPPPPIRARAAPAVLLARSTPGDTTWARFRDVEIRVALAVPTTWLLSTSKPYGLTVHLQPDSSGDPSFDIGPVEPRSSREYSNFAAWVRDRVTVLRTLGTVTAQRAFTVGGLSAAQIETEASAPKKAYFVYTFIGAPDTLAGPDAGLMFQLVMAARDQARAREYKAAHDRIVESIEILPEP
jgi:hypothetical protein